MATAHKPLPHHAEDWKGYTIDELRYMRAYTAARIEINRDRIVQRASAMKNGNFALTGRSGIVSKVVSSFGYLDMALIAWKVGRGIFNTVRIFKRK